jgi:hypothetical protein
MTNQKPRRKSKLKVGDYVRVSKMGDIFTKGYMSSWSTEIFKIIKMDFKDVFTYKLNDLNDQPIIGSFYSNELQKITYKPKDQLFKINQILKSRKKGKRKQVLVSWVGYPSSFDSWIDATKLKTI